MTYEFKQESNEDTSSTSLSNSSLSIGKLTPVTNSSLLPIETVVKSTTSSNVKPDSVRLYYTVLLCICKKSFLYMQIEHNLTSLLRSNKELPYFKPYLDDTYGSMLGLLQCMIIDSYGGKYEDATKAVSLEVPNQNSMERLSIIDKNMERQTTIIDPTLSMVDKDVKTIRGLIENDYMKEYAFSLYDEPNAQRSKQFYLDSMEILFKECTKAGGSYVTTYYSLCNIF